MKEQTKQKQRTNWFLLLQKQHTRTQTGLAITRDQVSLCLSFLKAARWWLSLIPLVWVQLHSLTSLTNRCEREGGNSETTVLVRLTIFGRKKQTTTTTHTSIWCLLKFCSIAVSHAFGTNEGNLHTLGHWVALLFGVCISDCYSYWEISPASYGLPMVMAPTMLTESVLLLHATSPKHICQKLTLTWWSQIALGCCETSQLCLFCSYVSLSSLSFNSWNSVFHGLRERLNIIGTVACFHDF